MKILLCHNYYQQRGGEDQVFDDEARLLESYGHRVLRFTRHNDSVAELSRLQLASRTIFNVDVYRELRAILARERPEVMHCTNTFPLLSPAVYDAARAEGVPVVQSLHNYRLLCPNALFLRDGQACEDCLGKLLAWPAIRHGCYRGSRAATGVLAGMLAIHKLRGTWINKVDRYIALAQFAREKLIAGGLPPKRIAVKPNFVLAPPAPGAGEGRFALFAGRLSEEKGTGVILEAWSKLRPDIELRILGDGPQAGLVRQATAADPRIRWLGRLPPNEVLSQMAQAAVLVLPSLCYEMCPKTLIESFAVGTPVVASRLGSMIEMVDHGRTGWHFRHGDAGDLAACLERIWQHPQQLQHFRQAAHDEYLDKYTAERNYHRLIEIYRSVVGRAATEPDAEHESEPALMP